MQFTNVVVEVYAVHKGGCLGVCSSQGWLLRCMQFSRVVVRCTQFTEVVIHVYAKRVSFMQFTCLFGFMQFTRLVVEVYVVHKAGCSSLWSSQSWLLKFMQFTRQVLVYAVHNDNCSGLCSEVLAYKQTKPIYSKTK
ncbi:hypothetical protein CHS0354_032904 [Potamilus streckersoni]|uniref:Uncharacterized protein n=1 Tax=Potamilus streckersoni TaxID=2493646 RepID=A0AAE0VKE0_9BIVA|nr:hypothetical protein CHS0354_032904 [Potamilus streckersoni]